MTAHMRSSKTAIWLLVLANVLLPVALLTFAKGFFPYKPFLTGTNNFNAADLTARPYAPFDKVVFMVVDALRSDFVYGNNSGFSFVQSLIRSGEALPFTGHATSPTITMPRVKALTTGSIPSFLDVILNFAESDTTSTLANQDTWPLQLSLQEEGKVNMFGDDTWIKLFPDLFTRMDGTTSFFVSDFTEVDQNVTRNVPGELVRGDWNGVILHYLGLDHIGHKAGPNSPNIVPKQQEMDGIVKIIYQHITTEPHLGKTLLVLCGDHGMNEAGNHGGSAPGETSPALVFISPKLKEISQGLPSPADQPKDEFQYYSVVEQSDVVPTLAGLLGFPIPLNNLGVFIPEFLPFWPSFKDQNWLVLKNIEQMMGIVKPAYSHLPFDAAPDWNLCYPPDSDDTRLLCDYWDADRSLQTAYKFLRDTQSMMSSVSSNYNMALLLRGVSLSVISYVAAVLSILFAMSRGQMPSIPKIPLFWILATQCLYGVMMFASSYVEEEQHFWYWMSSAWLAWLYFSRYPSSRGLLPGIGASLPLIISRIVRRWNQTGQKFAGEPDIAKTFLRSHNQLLWTLALITYTYIFLRTWRWQINSPTLWSASFGINSMTVVAAVAFKIAFTAADAPELLEGIGYIEQARDLLGDHALNTLAIYVFLGTLLAVLLPMVHRFGLGGEKKPGQALSYLHSVLTILLITQTRLNNIPLLLVFSIQLSSLEQLNLSLSETTLTIFLLQHASYFAYGGSNAISSIDLSNAYNGVTGYNVIAVGLLTFVSNWAGPVWWSIGGLELLIKQYPTNTWQAYYKHLVILSMLVASSVLFVQVACLMLRTHLFIWTVFSPKYLYMMAWALGQHLGLNVLLSLVIIWMVKA